MRLPGVEVSLAGNDALFYFVLVLFALVLVGLWRLIHSPFGRVLRAIKQNEMRAAFVGYDVRLYKWCAFVISAGLSGLAGGLFAMAQQSAYPNVMSLHNSGFVVMMVLIGGGLVSLWGPVIGALVFILARDLARDLEVERGLRAGRRRPRLRDAGRAHRPRLRGAGAARAAGTAAALAGDLNAHERVIRRL